MFKYISEILSKLSMGQRLLALVFLLLSITFISVGPKIVNAFTQDNEELKTKVELQRSEIIELPDPSLEYTAKNIKQIRENGNYSQYDS